MGKGRSFTTSVLLCLIYFDYTSCDVDINEISTEATTISLRRSWPAAIDPENTTQFETKINVETLRLAHGHLGFVLHSIPGPSPSKNWEFLQKMKKIVSGYCPYLSPYILNGMMRMFRHLFRLYGQTYMNSARIIKTKRDQKILDILEKCYSHAQPIPIETCFSYSNSTIPEEIRFKFPTGDSDSDSGYDFPIETIWKIFLFSHFKCATDFSQSSIGLSDLYLKMEAFLNPGIRYRWSHPGISYEAFQTAFLSYDLKKFAYILDHCVTEAFKTSQYPQLLLRPISTSTTDL